MHKSLSITAFEKCLHFYYDNEMDSFSSIILSYIEGFCNSLKDVLPSFKTPCVRVSIFRCISLLITDFETTIDSCIPSLLPILWDLLKSYRNYFEIEAVFKEEGNIRFYEGDVSQIIFIIF